MFLKGVLNEANKHKRQQKIRYANAHQINAVSELVMNILRGAIRQGRTTLSRLKPQATNFVLSTSKKYKKTTTAYDASVRRQCVTRIKRLLSLRSKSVSLLR